MNVIADTSDLDKLVALLQTAADRPAKDRGRVLAETAATVADEARGIVAGYTKASTGELRSSIYVRGTPLTQEVGTDVRQGHFLEAGSPTTGAARPWLTGPAERGIDGMLTKLGKLGDLW